MMIVVMGVSGCGKSTIGKALANTRGWPFLEGDEQHPQTNIDKMRAGVPLDDVDRWPWLDRIANWMSRTLQETGVGVVACSALKRCYRDRLRRAGEGVRFVHIDVSRDELQRRLRQRIHFMPASLLDSQLRTLELPASDENALIVSGEQALTAIVADITTWLGLPP